MRGLYPDRGEEGTRTFVKYWNAAYEERGEDYVTHLEPGPGPRLPDHVAWLCAQWVQEGVLEGTKWRRFDSMAEVRSG